MKQKYPVPAAGQPALCKADRGIAVKAVCQSSIDPEIVLPAGSIAEIFYEYL